MPRATRPRRPLGVVACALILAGWYLTLAPTRIGGPLTPVLVRGSSMLPTYEPGDLVVAYRAGRYRTDDVVAFRVPSGQVVIHRVARVDGDRLVTRGDNRAQDDPWSTTSDDVLGSARFVVPGVGQALRPFARPEPAAVLAGVVAFLVVLLPNRTQEADRRRDPRGTLGAAGLLLLVTAPVTGLAAGLTVTTEQLAALSLSGPFDTYVATPGGGGGGGCNGMGNKPGC